MSEYTELKDDELEAALQRAGMGQEPILKTEPEPEEKPDEQPEARTEQTTEEPPETKEAVVEEQPEAEAKPEPAPEDEEVDDKEILRLKLEEIEARAKHWEQVAGRHGGELGFLKKQLEGLRTARTATPEEEISEEFAEERPTRRQEAPARKGPDPVSTWAVNQAIERGVANFFSQNAEANSPDFLPKIGEYMKKSGYDPAQLLESDDPISAQRESQRLLEEAYWHVKADLRASKVAELEQRRAAQTAKLKDAKKKASVSATASSPPPKPKDKTLEEMSLEELEAEMLKVTGGSW